MRFRAAGDSVAVLILVVAMIGCGRSHSGRPRADSATSSAKPAAVAVSQSPAPTAVVASPSLPADSDNSAQNLAIGLLDQVGGKYDHDANARGAPIIKLDLAGSKISDTGLRQLGALTSVQDLDLSGCSEVGDAGLVVLCQMQDLKRLILWGCHHVTDQGFENLQALTKLERLNIGNTAVETTTGSGLVHLRGLTNLRFLELTGLRNLDEQNLEHLVSLKCLEELGLGSMEKLTEAGLDHVQRIPRLRSLDLEGTHATDAWLEKLKNWHQLKSLNLAHTHVTDVGVAKLQESLPELIVTRQHSARRGGQSPNDPSRQHRLTGNVTF